MASQVGVPPLTGLIYDFCRSLRVNTADIMLFIFLDKIVVVVFYENIGYAWFSRKTKTHILIERKKMFIQTHH